ncbi:hypothetical protein H0K13_004504 [Salmonella enterica]|uniref:hypothetical protein n=1 Tax=Salmonella enterica TaxID=28901 RepID=UPI00070D3EE5|nr:hypothetical protein [Salmonella enterica]ATI93556.1 hypothetical protein CGA23_26625 [Salmonella enterica subsp. enterica]EAA8036382.1 hypothetical protein [Salmonella enterica subsp. enterica serovar Duisburg]EAQ4379573.1 hypothetical protein [Salmonella enterica subsp. enterica serovar Javiana]EBL5123923.1 hypothetical protein [Salmonella enterica subsp. enterica serovar Rubislaw]ECC3884137.1 hypothetical protein [Salmonella enterica subsp. diarizonae]ECH8185413.1 hypothetical protein [
MSEPFNRETLETIRDIIRETMPGNVAIALLINISPDYMVHKNIPSFIMLFIFITTIISIGLWMFLSVINYLSKLRLRRATVSFAIFILWLSLFIALTVRYINMLSAV